MRLSDGVSRLMFHCHFSVSFFQRCETGGEPNKVQIEIGREDRD